MTKSLGLRVLLKVFFCVSVCVSFCKDYVPYINFVFMCLMFREKRMRLSLVQMKDKPELYFQLFLSKSLIGSTYFCPVYSMDGIQL